MAKLKPNQFYLPSGSLITERGLLYQTEMVKANMENRKTQTRREVKNYPEGDQALDLGELYKHNPEYFYEICPYGRPGDLLYGRETWSNLNGDFPEAEPFLVFKSDLEHPNQHGPVTWKPSIHLPKAASRLWVMVEDTLIERVQDISEADAIAEGVKYEWYDESRNIKIQSAKSLFKELWKSINGEDSWKSNSWVWVIKYRILSKSGRPSLEEIEKNYLEVTGKKAIPFESGVCKYCACTDTNCMDCIERTGGPCYWVDKDHTLCSACVDLGKEVPNV